MMRGKLAVDDPKGARQQKQAEQRRQVAEPQAG